MTEAFDPRDIRRLARTLRVAVQTTLAGADLARGRSASRPGASFLALAAKGVDDWRFPADGLLSADGLVLARVLEGDGAAPTLELQAQGAAGLATYGGRSVRLHLGKDNALEAGFNRDGRLRYALDPAEASPADLAAFQIEILDDLS